jgi:hypothetical protein
LPEVSLATVSTYDWAAEPHISGAGWSRGIAMKIWSGIAVVACVALLGALPAAARGKGPGTVFTCAGGKVTKATPVIVSNGPPKGSGFVQTLSPGADPAAVCEAINASANIIGGFKTETEGTTVVVVYGADVRLNHVPDGINLKIQKF